MCWSFVYCVVRLVRVSTLSRRIASTLDSEGSTTRPAPIGRRVPGTVKHFERVVSSCDETLNNASIGLGTE